MPLIGAVFLMLFMLSIVIRYGFRGTRATFDYDIFLLHVTAVLYAQQRAAVRKPFAT